MRRDYFLERLQTNELAGVEGFHLTNQVVLRIPRLGRDVYARAEWPEGGGEKEGYRYEVAELVIDRTARQLFRESRRSGEPLQVLLPGAWEGLVMQLMERVVPDGVNRAVLLLVQNHELIFYRDEEGAPKVAPLAGRPKEVEVVRTINDQGFAEGIVLFLEESLRSTGEAGGQLLFATAGEPPFVAVDVGERSTVFLSRGMNPEQQLAGSPVALSVRTLDLVLIRSHLIMLLKNPFTLVFRGLAAIGNTGAVLLNSGVADFQGTIPPVSTGPGMDLGEWEVHLDGIVSAPRYRGGIEFFIDGEQFFPALIQSIQEAERRIDLRTYIFDNDDYAVGIAELLRVRSKEVKVKVLMDSLGSLFAGASLPDSPMAPEFVQPDDIADFLESGSKVQVRRTTNPWFTADHCKTLIFDEQEVYLGGMNIGREYRYDWHDMMVRIRGPIVSRFVRDFKRAWAHSGWLGDLAYWGATMTVADRGKGKPGGPEAIDLRPLYTKTMKRDIYRAQVEAIERSRHYVYIQNSYLSDDSILQALVNARARGVDVRVILPADNDGGIMSKSNLVTANRMIRAGIRVFVYPGMSHMKAAIYDGWACLGSANFDKLSLRSNQEIDVAFSDPEMVGRLKRELFEVDFERSRELLEPVPVGWTDYLIEVLADQL